MYLPWNGQGEVGNTMSGMSKTWLMKFVMRSTSPSSGARKIDLVTGNLPKLDLCGLNTQHSTDTPMTAQMAIGFLGAAIVRVRVPSLYPEMGMQ